MGHGGVLRDGDSRGCGRACLAAGADGGAQDEDGITPLTPIRRNRVGANANTEYTVRGTREHAITESVQREGLPYYFRNSNAALWPPPGHVTE